LKTIILMVMGLMIWGTSYAVELKDASVTIRHTPTIVKTLENGITVYVFDPDQGAPAPVCEGGCAAAWPPVILTSQEESGLSQIGLGSIKRNDGQIQLTFQGRPVYTFASDKVPGDVKGDGLGNVWHAARP
jgi:predicted lipoprotein with Yx(FWY)xxD motif